MDLPRPDPRCPPRSKRRRLVPPARNSTDPADTHIVAHRRSITAEARRRAYGCRIRRVDGQDASQDGSEARFTTIDAPGSAEGSVIDINDYGDMVGIYSDDPALTSAHGFLLKAADEGAYPYGRVRTALKSIFGIDPIRLEPGLRNWSVVLIYP